MAAMHQYEIVLVVETERELTSAEERALMTFASETLKRALLSREGVELGVSGRALGVGIRPVPTEPTQRGGEAKVKP